MNPNHLRDYGVQFQENHYALDPMIIEKSHGGEEFIASLKSQGTSIFLDVWTPLGCGLEYK